MTATIQKTSNRRSVFPNDSAFPKDSAFPTDSVRLEALRRTLHIEARYVLHRDDLADDAVQQVLIRFWETSANYDPDRGPLLKWLRFLTRNAAIDIIRHEGRQRRNEALGRQQAVVVGSPEGELEHTSRRDDLDRVLSKIDEQERAAIELNHLGERTHVEIATELEVPLGTVKSRIRRGMNKLAEIAPEVIEL